MVCLVVGRFRGVGVAYTLVISYLGNARDRQGDTGGDGREGGPRNNAWPGKAEKEGQKGSHYFRRFASKRSPFVSAQPVLCKEPSAIR